MAETNDKAQEALLDAERPSIPPPAYQETSTTYIETEDYHMVEAPETMSQEKESPMAGPSTAVHDSSDENKPSGTPTRAPPMLKEKGPAYPARPDVPASGPNGTQPVDEKAAIPADVLPSAEEEKKALQVHFAKPEGEEATPALPRRPSAIRFTENFAHDSKDFNLAPSILPAPVESSVNVPLKYVFSWNRPLLDFPTLEIKPLDNAIIPSTSPRVPPTAHWRLNYYKKYHARLQRYTATPNDADRNTAQAADFPFRQIAEIKFPEFIIPGVGCGATVKFDLHEEELARLGNFTTVRGKKPLPRVQKFMQCEGWLTTSYIMEVPVLDHQQTSWKPVPRPKTAKTESGMVEAAKETAIVERKTTDMEREAKKQNITLVTIGDMIEAAKRTINNENWTPYSPQQLVVESDGRVVATYQRASPFAKHAGILTIHQPKPGQVSSLPEFVEGIIIATTAMVGMQDRIGLASSLMEAASTSGKWSQEQWIKMQREWKDRKAKRQSNTHPYGNPSARARGLHEIEDKEVGSEIFEDGLGGVISDKEREAARREQMAWDEGRKAGSGAAAGGLAGAISAEEMEAARKEHLAWEERNRANTLPAAGTELHPIQEVTRWEEKPKFVYA